MGQGVGGRRPEGWDVRTALRAVPVVMRECPKPGGTGSRLESENLSLPLGRWPFGAPSPSLLLTAGVQALTRISLALRVCVVSGDRFSFYFCDL